MHRPRLTITRQDFIEREPRDDRVLVVVFLRGGADGLTLVPPLGDDDYHRARPLLSVRPADAIDLDGRFGLHAELRPLARHFDEGNLAVVHGAGSEDRTRSHFEAQDTMEHGGVTVGSGWLARYLRARGPAATALSAVAIGTTRPESLRGAPGGAVIQTIRDFALGDDDPGFVDRLEQLYAAEIGALGEAGRATIGAVRTLRELRARDEPPAHGAAYPSSPFGRGLREIARLVKADVGLAATTIDLDGWDTHFVQATVIDDRMRDLADGLDAFSTDLGDARRRVDVVVMTEFGRRLRENSSFGTDHGAGSAMLLMGEAIADRYVPGGIELGWPDLSEASLDDVGDVPAAIDFRDVLRPILADHASGIDLERVFPQRS